MKSRYLRCLLLASLLASACGACQTAVSAADLAPTMVGFKQLAPRQFEVVVSWKVVAPASPGYVIFSHFCSPTPTDNGDILVQPELGLDNHPDRWKAGTTLVSKPIVVTLPANATDATYDYKVGIVDTKSGDRGELLGESDGSNRYSLGKVIVSNGGKTITAPGKPAVTPEMEGLVDATSSVVNFRQAGLRQFSFQLSVDVKSRIPADEQIFVHLTVPTPDAQHPLIVAVGTSGDIDTAKWPVGQQHVTPAMLVALQADLADGEYSLRAGFWSPSHNGDRLRLTGKDDGSLRYIVGTVVVSGNGAKIELKPQ